MQAEDAHQMRAEDLHRTRCGLKTSCSQEASFIWLAMGRCAPDSNVKAAQNKRADKGILPGGDCQSMAIKHKARVLRRCT